METSYNNSSASDNARQHNGNVYNSNTNNYNLPSSHPFAQILSTQGQPTPLHKACAKGDEDLVRSLVLEQGANIEAQDDDWMTPLQLAVYKNKINVARVLLGSCANVEAQCKFWGASQPPLFLAVSAGNEEMIRLLLESGAEIEGTNFMQHTALCLAAKDGAGGAVELLLAKGADIEAKDKAKCTPLWWAAFQGHADVITTLLGHGASRDAKARNGATVYDAARRKTHIVEWLKQG